MPREAFAFGESRCGGVRLPLRAARHPFGWRVPMGLTPLVASSWCGSGQVGSAKPERQPIVKGCSIVGHVPRRLELEAWRTE